MKLCQALTTLAAVTVMASYAPAFIIHSGTVNAVVNIPPAPTPPSSSSTNFWPVDVNGDGAVEVQLNYERTATTSFSFLWAHGGARLASVSGPGALIGDSSVFQTTANVHGPGSPPAQTLFGLSLTLADGVHYGWIRAEYTGNASVILRDWAYESLQATVIPAGQIPAPAAALLLLPFVGRRRRP